MNIYTLRETFTGNRTDALHEVNGFVGVSGTSDLTIKFQPFGDKFAAPLRTTTTTDFGAPSNQKDGITNGLPTHTGAATGSGKAATTLTGSGSGATFAYAFAADGSLTSITADTAGTGYKVGDKLSIDTTEGHTIEFRLVDGSNALLSVKVELVHDRAMPLPFAVHKVRVDEASDATILIYDRKA